VISERRYVDAARSTITMATLLHGLVGDSEDCDVRIVKAMRVCAYDTLFSLSNELYYTYMFGLSLIQ
jgi:hypothetical protein